ncbi:MAG: hypothetical protein IKA79_08680, partial [Lentisphaeria bacterium]|nr:hypothetical protein [Lentisphaeria bacterium]
GAYLFMRFFMKDLVRWDILEFFVRKKVKKEQYVFTSRPPKENISVSSKPGNVDLNEADRVLEKLSRQGINSLTEEEISLLERLRKEMNDRNRR